MPVPETLLYLTERDVQQTLSVVDAVDLAEAGIEVHRVEPKANANRKRRLHPDPRRPKKGLDAVPFDPPKAWLDQAIRRRRKERR